jgi:uncharacterized membrane protein (DUF2068 family)
MNTTDISTLRLQNQQVAATKFKTANELVGWMGAMQAQDYNQAKWAIGVRLPHLTEDQIESAFNQGDILRTHLMRPTWHFVSPEDIYWLVGLSAKQIKSSMKTRNRQLELTEEVFKTSQEVIIKALEGNHHLTRDELSEFLNAAGISTKEQRLPHILMEAEIDRIICSGPLKGKKQTYALLEERVPNKIELTTDEALALLARKYFTSHGPATLADFTWWSGLPVSQARKAIALNDKNLHSEIIDGETYWMADQQISTSPLPHSAFLLPAFDEYLVSYKNREAAINEEDHAKAVSKNGIFWPIVVINRQISGLWKKTAKKDLLIIEINHFRPHSNIEIKLLEQAAEFYGYYYQQKVKVLFK